MARIGVEVTNCGNRVEWQGLLPELKVGDVVENMRVVSGAENLVNSSLSKKPSEGSSNDVNQQQQQQTVSG